MAFTKRMELGKELMYMAEALKMYANYVGELSATEFACSVFSLLMTAKHVLVLLEHYHVELMHHPFNGNVIDFKESLYNLEAGYRAFSYALEDSYVSPVLTFEDNSELDDLIADENAKFSFGKILMKEERSLDGNYIKKSPETSSQRHFLLDNQKMIVDELSIYIDYICNKIKSIKNERKELIGNSENLTNYLIELEREYVSSGQWDDDKECFILDMRDRMKRIDDERQNWSKEMYAMYLKQYHRKADNISKAKLISHENMLALLRDECDIIEEDRIIEHFRYMKCYELLDIRVKSFDYISTIDEHYPKLFSNLAASIIVKSIIKTIIKEVDIRKGYNYGIVKLAFEDFGLLKSRINDNAQEWIDFLQEHFGNNVTPSIPNNNSITKVTGKLLSREFKKLTPNSLQGTNITSADFEKYKKVYLHCIHIINKVMNKDLKEEGFADYWLDNQGINMKNVEFENMDEVSMLAKALQNKDISF